MKVKAVILAGGEGTRLATLPPSAPNPPFLRRKIPHHRLHSEQLCQLRYFRRADPDAVSPAQPQRPHRRGRPWDLDRSFTGGVQILQPYKGRLDTDWYSARPTR